MTKKFGDHDGREEVVMAAVVMMVIVVVAMTMTLVLVLVPMGMVAILTILGPKACMSISYGHESKI